MTVKARWASADLVIDVDSDPFADDAPEPRPAQFTGLTINLAADSASLEHRLVDLVEQEGILFNQGVECAVKNESTTSCWCCPLYRGEQDGLEASLCRIGREQDSIITLLKAREVGGR